MAKTIETSNSVHT